MKTGEYVVKNSGSGDVNWSMTMDDGNYQIEEGEMVNISGKGRGIGKVIKVRNFTGLNHLGTRETGDALAVVFENNRQEFFGWFTPKKEMFVFV